MTALRPPRSSDVGRFVGAFEEEAELAELLGFEVDPSADYMKERLRRHRRVLREGRSVSFTIADPASDEFLGEVLLHTFDWQHSRAALGIWVRREARGGGRALDALRMICGYGFDELGWRGSSSRRSRRTRRWWRSARRPASRSKVRCVRTRWSEAGGAIC